MCRSKELGGRRCPQYTDPVKHAAYNQRRREIYAAKKAVDAELTTPKGLDLNGIIQTVTHSEFDPIHSAFLEESHALREKVHPDYIDSALSDEEKETEKQKRENMITAAHYYTREGYKMVSVYLNRVDPPEQAVRYYKDTIEGLDGIISAAGLRKAPTHVYRGIQLPENVDADYLDQWLEESFPVGGVVSQRNYMSTSVNPLVGLNFGWDNAEKLPGVFFEILTKKGAALGDNISAHANNEHEVLMPRNARFKIESIIKEVDIETAPLLLGTEYPPSEKDTKKKRIFIRLIDADEEIS